MNNQLDKISSENTKLMVLYDRLTNNWDAELDSIFRFISIDSILCKKTLNKILSDKRALVENYDILKRLNRIDFL
jgi:hypothetical protein